MSAMHCHHFEAGRCRSCTLLATPYPDQLAGKQQEAQAQEGPGGFAYAFVTYVRAPAA